MTGRTLTSTRARRGIRSILIATVFAMAVIAAAWPTRAPGAIGSSSADQHHTFSRSLPFGPKQLPTAILGQPPLYFSGGYVNMTSIDELTRGLADARASRARLILKLVGSRTRFQNPDGSFSLALWKHELDKVKTFDFAPYVADGTVIGIELINEPHDPNNWGRRIVSKEDLEAAAAYAKSYWPYMPVGAGRPDYVLKNAPWQHLDFAHAQYHMRKGDIERWREMTVAQSKAAGVGLLLSLNFLAGEIGDRPMAAAEVKRFLAVLAADTYACSLSGYLYDATYLSQPDMQAAFEVAGAIAQSHPAPPCYVGHVK